MRARCSLLLALLLASGAAAQKSEPANVYLYPAGGQRGTQVTAVVEGENVTSRSDFHLAAARGVTAPPRTRDRKITLTLAPDASAGWVRWRIATAQGGTGSRGFVVGEFPEIVERADRGDAPEPVRLPVTANGRISHPGDVDRYAVELRAGQPFSAEVVAARLGGPLDTNVFFGQFGNPDGDVTSKYLDASLAVYGPDGKLAARAEDTFGPDPALGFVAPRDGRYVVAVHHLAHRGMPQFVYRLTLAARPLVESVFPAGGRRGTSASVRLHGPAMPEAGPMERAVRFDAASGEETMPLPGDEAACRLRVGDLPEVLESEPNDGAADANPAELPAVLNGRFLAPGDADTYRVTLRKGETWRFEAWVERLGSPTDALLSLLGPDGQMLATDDDGAPGSRDPCLWFTAPADGEYLLQIRDGAMSRLGERLVYRLEARPQAPDFEVEATPEFADVLPGKAVEVNVTLHRRGGFNGPVTLAFEGLPEGVTAAPLELKPGQPKGKLKLEAAASAPSGSRPVRVTGRATIDGSEVARGAVSPVSNAAETAGNSAPRFADDLLLTVLLPPPFEIEADESYVFMHLGTLYPAPVNIRRGPGYTAPLLLTAADRQPRNPYGITFAPLRVEGQEERVLFPMHVPQGPRGNDIVRMYVKAEAVYTDARGREWDVLRTSAKQVVLRTTPPVLSLAAEPEVLRAAPGERAEVRFRIGRTNAVNGPAEVRLRLPAGARGISMEPVRVAAGETEAVGVLHLAPDAAPGRDRELRFEVTSRHESGNTCFFLVGMDLDLRRR